MNGRVDLMRGETHFLCCICFDPTLYEEAYEDAAGTRWDMCPMCGSRETAHAKRMGES